MRFGCLPFVAIGAVLFVIVAVPVWLAVMSVVSMAMPWLFFGVLAWVVIRSADRPPRRRWNRLEWRPAPAQAWTGTRPSPPRLAAPARLLPVAPPSARLELPIDVQVKVEQIRRKAEVLLGYQSRFPPYSKDLYLVRQTAAEYLPRTIDAYLAIPAIDAERVLPHSGKTALQELHEQLDLLDGKLDDIADNLQQRDFDRFLANRRFLEQRFGPYSA
jgi:hypothetical protein